MIALSYRNVGTLVCWRAMPGPVYSSPAPPRWKPTLDAVAERAGVSPMTVSRVMRIPEKVRLATRTRVEAAIEAVGYVPNLVAGSLASARTRTIAVLVPTIANAIFADTVQGLSDEVERAATR
jgi:LacI family gluconate utilization system Gnt-I transcriptional repressor